MSKPLDALHAMLERLEEELPGLMVLYPDADGADFWMAFSQRSTRIEAMAGSAHVAQVRERLDRMLVSRGLLDAPEPFLDAPEPSRDAAAVTMAMPDS